MITIAILINGEPIHACSTTRIKEGGDEVYEYKIDDGSIVKHKYNDGTIVLVKKMLDTIKRLKNKWIKIN